MKDEKEFWLSSWKGIAIVYTAVKIFVMLNYFIENDNRLVADKIYLEIIYYF